MAFHLRAGGAAVRAGKAADLTQGPVAGGLLRFALPLFLGQLLQQFYHTADSWVIGNFASNDAFAAVSSGGSLTFLVIGLFNGIAMGGGVVISRYFGAKDEENVIRSIHNNFLFSLIASVVATVMGLVLVPQMLRWMQTPDSVLPESLAYFRVYFGGVSTIILYNSCMGILRALGDSLHPLYYLILSSLVNVGLDLLFVAVFRWGVTGAAVATVIAQGLSVVLCVAQLLRMPDPAQRLDLRKLKWDSRIMGQILRQGLPSGIQNSVISLGNVVVQTNINSFGAFAMAGHGAQARLEGFGFLPITAMSMSLPTFISQNVGAGRIDRAKKGAVFGIGFGMICAQLVGVVMCVFAPQMLRFFVDEPMSVEFGTIHLRTTALFYFLLAFSHCAAGTLRGLGRSTVPMVTMLSSWCGFRILYVTVALQFFPVFRTISWAYPITWCLSSIVYLIYLLRMDWNRGRL